MASVTADAIIKIGWLIGGTKARHIDRHCATEFPHTRCQNLPIPNGARIAVHKNHRFVGIGWSEFEQRRTYPVNDDRRFAHSATIDFLAILIWVF
jgi:hypothetical protein